MPENLKLEVSDFIDFLLCKAIKDNGNVSIPKATFGSAKEILKMNTNFDKPLEDFKEYMQ